MCSHKAVRIYGDKLEFEFLSDLVYFRRYRRSSLTDAALPQYQKYLYEMLGPSADYFLHPKMEDEQPKKIANTKIHPKLWRLGGQ